MVFSPAETEAVFKILRQIGEDQHPEGIWGELAREQWPVFFRLLDLGALLPPLSTGLARIGDWPVSGWPEFAHVSADLQLLQHHVEHATVPVDCRMAPIHTIQTLNDAAKDLNAEHCATIDCFLTPDDQLRLDTEIAKLKEQKDGSWGALRREDSPELFATVETGLQGTAFRTLTGFDLDRDEYSVTLSLQSLAPEGIAWHRDLYWPKEWVGEDVFSVFHSLGADSPEKGGAFVYYNSERNDLAGVYRQRHHTTILWNGRRCEDRILHAVTGYHTHDTTRHLLILQCLRRA